jgi:hypothetical protein
MRIVNTIKLNPFRIQTDLPPIQVCERLQEYARQWKESRLPDSVRQAGKHGVKVRIYSDCAFAIRLLPTRNGPNLVCRGFVVEEHGRSGVHAALTFTPGTAIEYGMWFILCVALGAASGSIVFAAISVLFGFVPVVFCIWAADQDARYFRAIIETVVQDALSSRPNTGNGAGARAEPGH